MSLLILKHEHNKSCTSTSAPVVGPVRLTRPDEQRGRISTGINDTLVLLDESSCLSLETPVMPDKCDSQNDHAAPHRNPMRSSLLVLVRALEAMLQVGWAGWSAGKERRSYVPGLLLRSNIMYGSWLVDLLSTMGLLLAPEVSDLHGLVGRVVDQDHRPS